MNRIAKGLSVFQTIEVIIAVIIVAVIFLPSLFGYKTFIVKSGSMEPTIKTHALAYVDTGVNCKNISKGDIIAFNISDNTVVTHRAVGINSDDEYFTTKGDANKSNDPAYVRFKQVIGKTVFSIPYLGGLLTYLQTISGKIILGVIVTVNILLGIIINENSQNRKEGMLCQ